MSDSERGSAVRNLAAQESKATRTMSWRTDRVSARWRAKGWEVVAQSRGRLRTTTIYERARVTKRSHGRLAMAIAVVVMLALVGFACFKFAPSTFLPIVDRVPGVTLDSDHDGIPDEVEASGWRTQSGVAYRTDPYRSDSDGDGLSDAVELGDISTDTVPASATFAVSDPLVADTDRDGIGDGDEYFLDLDPSSADTDDDGLLDGDELAIDSDPTLANPDDDAYADKEELDNDTDPMSYDLTGDEKRAATAAGLKYGDCDECALDAGLRTEQIESAEYLAGHFVSGAVVYGDIRDLALDLWKRKFAAAGLAVLGLLPFIGDSSKGAKLLTKFAERGDRAAQAVRRVLDELPLPDSVKAKVRKALPSLAGKLPRELAGGPKDTMVYIGNYYVGITRNFDVRKAQHAKSGRSFIPEPMPGATGLSRGGARAIEQACIEQGGLASNGGGLENKINSIDPKKAYKDAAVEYGLALLKKFGASCPIPAKR